MSSHTKLHKLLVTQSRGDDFISFEDGTQNEAGKVAFKGDSLAICQLRQKCAIAILSDYY